MQRPGVMTELLGGDDATTLSALRTGDAVDGTDSVAIPMGVDTARLFYRLLLAHVVTDPDGTDRVALPTLSKGFDQFLVAVGACFKSGCE